MLLIPSVLVKSESDFLAQTSAIYPNANHFQLDICDGVFVQNTTWADPEVVKTLTNLTVELHLMVNNPVAELKKWIGVPQIVRALVPIEKSEEIAESLKIIKEQNWKAGLVLNPETPIEKITPFANQINQVMLMGVVPGQQGQAFISETLEKIKQIKNTWPHLPVWVDGGVNLQTLPSILDAGADAICPGSAIFGNELSPSENIKLIKTEIEKLSVN